MASLLSKKHHFFSSMPEGTASIFIIQMVSTLSFSVLYSTLALYMQGELGVSMSIANSAMGVFIAFNYGLHLLGGFWGGNLFSNRALFCIGMLAQIVGCVLLSLCDLSFLYYGLAAFLTGSGLNVTCLNCMLTQRFAPDDARRETAFLTNYAGMNVGFFAGYSLSGIFQLKQDYAHLFLLSSLGNLTALIVCLYCWNKLADIGTSFSRKDKPAQRRSILTGLLLVMLMPIVLSQLLQFADWATGLVLLSGVIMFGVIIYQAKQQPTKAAHDKIMAFTVFMLVGMVFWTLFHIAPMGLTFFVDHNVQRELAGFIIPPQWFQNINTLCIVAGGPLLGILFQKMREKGIQINIPFQFTLALLCIGVAFVILPIGIATANSSGMVSASWVIWSYVLQSIGELFISPIGYAMIGYLAPPTLQGTMMGMWMMASGVGGALSSYSSNLMVSGMDSTSPLATNSGYSYVFLMLGLFAIGTSIVLFILVPRLRALIPEHAAKEHNDTQVAVAERVALCE